MQCDDQDDEIQDEENDDDDLSFLEVDVRRRECTDTLLKYQDCAMCHIDGVIVPRHGAVSTNHDSLQKIMNMHLAMSDNKADAVVYARMAEEYNRTCYNEMVNGGYECERWTPDMVRIHMTKHVKHVPRLVTRSHMEILNDLVTKTYQTILVSSLLCPDETDPKLIAAHDGKLKNATDTMLKAITLHAKLITDYRNYLVEDHRACGSDTVWIDSLNEIENANGTEQIAQAMYQNRTGQEPNDRPASDMLFEAQ